MLDQRNVLKILKKNIEHVEYSIKTREFMAKMLFCFVFKFLKFTIDVKNKNCDENVVNGVFIRHVQFLWAIGCRHFNVLY